MKGWSLGIFWILNPGPVNQRLSSIDSFAIYENSAWERNQTAMALGGATISDIENFRGYYMTGGLTNTKFFVRL